MMGSETNDLIEEFFKSLQKHQEILEKTMKIGKFVFHSVLFFDSDLLFCHLHSISLKRGVLYN